MPTLDTIYYSDYYKIKDLFDTMVYFLIKEFSLKHKHINDI